MTHREDKELPMEISYLIAFGGKPPSDFSSLSTQRSRNGHLIIALQQLMHRRHNIFFSQALCERNNRRYLISKVTNTEHVFPGMYIYNNIGGTQPSYILKYQCDTLSNAHKTTQDQKMRKRILILESMYLPNSSDNTISSKELMTSVLATLNLAATKFSFTFSTPTGKN